MIHTSDMDSLFNYQEMQKFLPAPRMDNPKDTERLGSRKFINMDLFYMLKEPNQSYLMGMIQHFWDDLYTDVFRKLALYIIGKPDYFFTRFVPRMYTERSVNMYEDGVVLELITEIFVAPTRNIFIPEFVYEPVASGMSRMVEWRCGYCRSPNELRDRHCSQCGSPRAVLIQEM